MNDEGEKLGVLDDWDLDTYADPPHDGLEHIGTIPFMAIELLLDDSMAHSAERLYRHDLEALFWVLVWVSSPAVMYSDWESGTYAQRRENKGDFLGTRAKFPIKEGFLGLSVIVDELKDLFNDIYHSRAIQRIRATKLEKVGRAAPKVTEESPQQIWQMFCDTLRDASETLKYASEHVALIKVLEDFLAYAPHL